MKHELLKIIRTVNGLSQLQAAECLGISKSYLSEIENGKKKVSLDILEKYKDIFDISPSMILFFDEQFKTKSIESIRLKMAKIFITELSKLLNDEKT